MTEYIKFWIAKQIGELVFSLGLLAGIVAVFFAVVGVVILHDKAMRWCRRRK